MDMEKGVKPKRRKYGEVEFDDDQLEEYKDAFTEFDIDGDGTITTTVIYTF